MHGNTADCGNGKPPFVFERDRQEGLWAAPLVTVIMTAPSQRAKASASTYNGNDCEYCPADPADE